jgi:uncharacterized protein YndB with AHSA1/START domain
MAQNPQSSTRKHEIELELDATPDEVFSAISEADKIQQWFAPDVKVKPGEGGSIYVGWGPGMGGEAPIRIWEPGKRFGWVEGEGTERPKQVTFEIEGSGGKTTLKLVNSGFGAGADFDNEFESVYGGWHTFFAMLQDGLARFKRIKGLNVCEFRMAERSKAEAWERMQTALAMTSTKEGEAFTGTFGGLKLDGTVKRHVKAGYLCLSLQDSILGIFVEGGKKGMVTIQWILFGEAATTREAETRAAIGRLMEEVL